jgi:hypothetical protein
MSDGYVYRRFPLDADGLRALLAEVFGEQPVWAFASNSVELSPIEQRAPAGVSLAGQRGEYQDGHVFNQGAEVRWKKRDGRYDALILAEHTLPAEPIRTAQGQPLILAVQRPPQNIAIALDGKSKGQLFDFLHYIEYIAPNGAVQFQRFVEVK